MLNRDNTLACTQSLCQQSTIPSNHGIRIDINPRHIHCRCGLDPVRSFRVIDDSSRYSTHLLHREWPERPANYEVLLIPTIELPKRVENGLADF